MLPMWKRRPRKVKDKSWVATEAPPLFLKDNQRSVCSLSSSDSFLHKFSQVLPSPDLTRPLRDVRGGHSGCLQSSGGGRQGLSAGIAVFWLVPLVVLVPKLLLDPPYSRQQSRTFFCPWGPWQAPQVHGKFQTPQSWQRRGS